MAKGDGKFSKEVPMKNVKTDDMKKGKEIGKIWTDNDAGAKRSGDKSQHKDFS